MAGSALSVLADTGMGIEQDAAVIRYNTLQSKYERDVQAVNFRNEASAARASAKNARTAGWLGGFTSLLSGGVRIVGMTAGTPTGARVDGGNITLRPWGQGYQGAYQDWYKTISLPPHGGN